MKSLAILIDGLKRVADAADCCFPYEHGDVVFLTQDRWKPDDQRERYVVVARVIIDSGADRPEIRYRLERFSGYSQLNCEVSEHAIDRHSNAGPTPESAPPQPSLNGHAELLPRGI